MLNPNGAGATTANYVADLVEELLDAHADTIRLARDLADDAEWTAHMEYLRGLQRVGREALARMPV